MTAGARGRDAVRSGLPQEVRTIMKTARRVRWSRVLCVALLGVTATLCGAVREQSARIERLEARFPSAVDDIDGRWEVVDYELSSGTPPTLVLHWRPSPRD